MFAVWIISTDCNSYFFGLARCRRVNGSSPSHLDFLSAPGRPEIDYIFAEVLLCAFLVAELAFGGLIYWKVDKFEPQRLIVDIFRRCFLVGPKSFILVKLINNHRSERGRCTWALRRNGKLR